MMKKYLVVLTVLFAFVLSGCASEASPDEYYGDYKNEDLGGSYSSDNSDLVNPEPEVQTPQDQGGIPESNQDVPALQNRKIIYKADLEMAVLDPSSTYNNVLDVIGDYTAYIEEADIREDYYNFTVRVLSTQFDLFVEEVKTNGELVSFSKTSEDVTNAYSTFEARYEALETKHARILELIEQAVDLDTILKLEDERYEIEAELNAIGNTLANYDSLVDYSTVEIIIKKAVEEIVVLPRTETPNLKVTEKTNHSLSLEVRNISDENVTIHVDLFLNGEFIEEYEEDTYADSIVEVTFDELKSNKEYTVKVTAIATEHRISLIEIMKTSTEKTYGNRLTNTFVGSVDLLVNVFEYAGLLITGILPFAVVGAVIFFPTRILIKKRKREKAIGETIEEEE